MKDTTRNHQPALSEWRPPLRIAMIAACPFPTHQGTQVFIRHLACALGRAGHEVHLFAYGEGDKQPVAGEADPFYLHRCVSMGIGARSGPQLLKPMADAALLYTCRRALTQRPYDVIHAHNVEGLAVAAALRRMENVPLVYHVHNAMGPELPTYFGGRIMRRAAGWLGELADRGLPRLADAIITFDQDHRALHEMYGVPESRLHVIAPGLDPQEIRGASPALVQALRAQVGDGPWILYAGNPDGYQNLPLLWKAYAKVRLSRPDVGLLIATHHAPAAFEAILPRGKKARRGIRIFQHHDLDELRAAFALASVGACPRSMWTGAPIKVLNYMAAGLPVVACKDAVRHILPTSMGEAVQAEPDAFATSLLNIIETGAARRTASLELDAFDIDAQVPLYERVYHSLHR